MLELEATRLQVSRFDGKSAATTRIGSIRSPFGFGFDAIERRAGGAIVAGASSSGGHGVIALVIDDSGHVSSPIATGLELPTGDPRVRLSPLPSGGALLTDFERHSVVWLDDDGRALARGAWAAQASDARCLDGRPAPAVIPSPEPGIFVPAPQLAAHGSCLSGELGFVPDGSVRFFAESVSGASTRAEMGHIDIGKAAHARPTPTIPNASLDAPSPITCPADMVRVAGRFCVDRFEGSLADTETGELVSADVAATSSFAEAAISEWATRRERVGDLFARAVPLPYVDTRTFGRALSPLALNRFGIRPSGYVTGLVASKACTAAGKRLCSLDEWRTACRGEKDTLFPYGADYVDGTCNVNREAHPAAILHNHSSLGHLDPRLNYATSNGVPLAETTGARPGCASHWGDDAIYDMVGNLDEWVDEGNGAFAGGFYSRGTKSGCGALVDNHPQSYLDYSTGVRCCKGGGVP